MEQLKIYEIQTEYIDFLSIYAPHLFRNKKLNQQNERKYIGIILEVNKLKYFAPLSSFKEKHKYMQDSIDFIKIKNFAVININNMFPVPDSQIIDFDFSKVKDSKYRALLQREYRFIKSIQKRIIESAQELYLYKLKNQNNTKLSKRCNNFTLLEQKAIIFLKK